MKTTRNNKTPKAQSRPDQHMLETAPAVQNEAPAPLTEPEPQPAREVPAPRHDTPKPPAPKIDLELRRTRRFFNVGHMVNLLRKEAPEIAPLTSRVGDWLWLRFDGVQPPEVTAKVAQLGFHWNNTRQVWQHPCGKFHKNPSTYDPRTRYGCQPIAA